MKQVLFSKLRRYYQRWAQSVLLVRFVTSIAETFCLAWHMPRGLRTLRLAFAETHLTHFAGMVLLQRFCNKLRLRWLLQKHVS